MEFEAGHLGRATQCPHCNGMIILTAPNPPEDAGGSGWNLLSKALGMDSKNEEMARMQETRQERVQATMEQIRNGTWQVEAQGVVLSATERALWRQAASSVDPGVVCGGVERNPGMTAKIFKSITTRLLQPPSKIRTARIAPANDSVPGEFVLTTSRLIFSSRERTMITRYENLVDVYATLDGVRYGERDKGTVYGIRYDQPNGDIISQIIDFGVATATATAA
jgi:hypothetical protein